MRIIFLIILGSWLSMTAGAQSYFNDLNALYAGQAEYFAVTEKNGKSYSVAEVLDSSHHSGGGVFKGVYGMRFIVRDENGRIIHNTYYESPSAFEVIPMAKTIVERFDSTFLVFCKTWDSGIAIISVLNFDSTGALLGVKKLPKPTFANVPSLPWFPMDAKEDQFGNVIILSSGTRYQIDNKQANEIVLSKLNKSLEVVWHKLYTDEYHNSASAAIIIEQNSYTVCATYDNTSRMWYDITSQTQILNVDTGGNRRWTWLSSQDSLEYVFNLVKTRDGGYAYCGLGYGYQQLSQSGAFTTLYFQGLVKKIDSAGKVLWSSNLNASVFERYYNKQAAIIELADGNLMVAGSIYDHFTLTDTAVPWLRTYGMLTKLSSTGKIIWQRKYVSPTDSLMYFVTDLIPTADKGFILVGSGKDIYPPIVWPSSLKAWTIKVDSNGCTSAIDPACAPVGITTIQKQSNQYIVFPNPSNSNFELRYFKNSEEVQKVVVIDINGRKIQEHSFKERSGQINLRLEEYPVGVYLYQVLEEGRVITSGKIIKN